MNKEFIPYEQALALKELRFDEPCVAFYEESKKLSIGFNWLNEGGKNSNLQECTAPLYQQAFRWFREKYGLVLEPCVPFQRLYSIKEDHFEILEFGYRIYSFDQFRGGLRDKIEWDGYDNSNEEEAELACLQKLIEIVEQKNEK